MWRTYEYMWYIIYTAYITASCIANEKRILSKAMNFQDFGFAKTEQTFLSDKNSFAC